MPLIYDTQRSGNAWKVRLLAGLLNIDLSRRTLSIDRGDLDHRSFRELSPLRQVPILVADNGEIICESMAILFRLSQGSPWWPRELEEQTRVLTWLSFEQERHMKPLAQLRLHLALRKDKSPDDYDMRLRRIEAQEALFILEAQLRKQQNAAAQWVATPTHPSIADVALYPYSRLANMGGIDIIEYPHISQWLERMEALPGYQPLFPDHPDLNFSMSER
jgi:glutathione S-transferase